MLNSISSNFSNIKTGNLKFGQNLIQKNRQFLPSFSGECSKDTVEFSTKPTNNVQDTLLKIEAEIVNSPVEVGVIIDQNNGQILLKKPSTKEGVDLTPKERNLLKENIYTHNHYENAALSITDLVSALQYEVKEVRAVTPTTKCSIKFPPDISKKKYCYDISSIPKRNFLVDNIPLEYFATMEELIENKEEQNIFENILNGKQDIPYGDKIWQEKALKVWEILSKEHDWTFSLEKLVQ